MCSSEVRNYYPPLNTFNPDSDWNENKQNSYSEQKSFNHVIKIYTNYTLLLTKTNIDSLYELLMKLVKNIKNTKTERLQLRGCPVTPL